MKRSVVLQHLQESLDRLQTEYVDMYWLHRDDRSLSLREILSWLEEPCKQGVIRAVGCSHWRNDRLAEAMALSRDSDLPIIRASQVAWSLAHSKITRTDGPYGEELAMDEDTWEFHVTHQLPVAACKGRLLNPTHRESSGRKGFVDGCHGSHCCRGAVACLQQWSE